MVLHNWYDGKVTTYRTSDDGDFIMVKLTVKNLGIADAEDVLAKCGFYTDSDQGFNTESETISMLKSGDRKEIILTADVPFGGPFKFKTLVYVDDEIVDEHESSSYYP